MPASQTIFLFVLGAISVIGGLVLGFRIMRVRRWPTVHGEIILKSVGHKYTGHQLFLTHRLEAQAAAQKRLDAMSDKITVHYNPAGPEQACAFVDSLILPIFVMLFGLVLLFAGMGAS